MTDIQYKDNGNILVDGKEYIPRARLETAIDNAVLLRQERREKLLKAAAILTGVIILVAVCIIQRVLRS